MHRTLLVTLLLLVIAGPARATDLAPPLEALVVEAQDAGLPAEAMRLKAREGLAKGVPVDRVEAVLRDMADQYLRARQLLPDASAGELDAVAAALRAGASREAVAALASVDGSVREAALRGLADLVQLDVDEVQALRLVRSASRQGRTGLSGLASATASLVRGGATPGEAARVVGLAVAQGRDPLATMPPQARNPGHRGGPGGNQGNGPPPHANPGQGSGNGPGNNNGNPGNPPGRR